jgi:tRNA(Ser,Leu) C12 N-acetylase TAN1
MKKILLVAAMLFIAVPNMQAKGNDEEVKIVLIKEESSDNYYYEGVIPVEGVSKEEMFKRAKDWVLSTLKTNDNNIKFDEKEFSIITSSTFVVKETSRGATTLSSAQVNFKLIIQFKEGKYKFHIDNVIVSPSFPTTNPSWNYSPKMYWLKKYNEYLIKEINKSFLNLSSVLEATIKGTGLKKDDW